MHHQSSPYEAPRCTKDCPCYHPSGGTSGYATALWSGAVGRSPDSGDTTATWKLPSGMVNIQKTIENCHVSFPIQNLWFSILVMLVYQRVSTNWVSRGGLQTDWTHSRDTVPNTHKMVLFLFAKSFGLPRLTLGLMLIITNLRLRGHQVVLGITYQKL